MFTTVMNQVINEATRHPTTVGGLPAASVSTSSGEVPRRASRSYGARRSAPSRWFRRESKPARPLPERYQVLASAFKVATGYF